MFKRKVLPLSEVLSDLIRKSGLETPLLQKRVVEGWDEVVGPVVARYTLEKFIKNQTLFVKISNPALRADLSMRRSEIVKALNDKVGAYIIADIRIY